MHYDGVSSLKCTHYVLRSLVMQDDEAARVATIVERLRQAYPDATCSLHFSNPLELLVATILSAQCTDERVNGVTARLFTTYRSAEDYANAPLEELEAAIKPTGFYRTKARHIQAAPLKALRPAPAVAAVAAP